jgi:predicted CopG family antitoxin
MDNKHTSELVSDFMTKLINRRSDLYEILHNYENQTEEEKILYNWGLDEINRIDKILKSIKKL